MKTICMYCNSLKADDGLNDGRVSHGVCLSCKPLVMVGKWLNDIPLLKHLCKRRSLKFID